MVDPVFFAVFKSFTLGDYIQGLPSFRVAGESVGFRSALYAEKASMVDRGARASWEIDIQAAIQKGAFPYTSETYEQFLQRRIGFLINMRKAMGYFPTSSLTTFGTIAGASDPARIYQLTGPESAGSSVSIGLTNPFGGPLPITVQNDERWFIWDPSTYVYELFKTDGSSGSLVVAEVLANNYTAAAYCFHAEWAVTNAALNPGAEIDGSAEGAHGVAKNIPLRFVSVDDPIFGTVAA